MQIRSAVSSAKMIICGSMCFSLHCVVIIIKGEFVMRYVFGVLRVTVLYFSGSKNVRCGSVVSAGTLLIACMSSRVFFILHSLQ